MRSQPLLSFCIPSYNRLIRVRELVLSLLSLPDDDIEVVVLDNGSTDGTFNDLTKITDPRFKLASNPENRGALFNMVNVFSYASGEYVIYSTDQDRTNVDRLEQFKAFLRLNPNISCGYCEFSEPGSGRHSFFARGPDAVRSVAYTCRHPTGYFFRNEHLRVVRLAERFSDVDVVGLFPLEFAFAEVSLLGEGAIYDGGLFSPNNSEDVVKHKSATTNGTSNSAFFSPAQRLKLAISFSQHVGQLVLPRWSIFQIQGQIFVAGLIAATIGYRAVMANDSLCIHYRMKSRQIGYFELFGICGTFIKGYFSQRFKGDRLSGVAFAMVVFVKSCCKLMNRMVRMWKQESIQKI